MDKETVIFLRAVCAKVKEIATICDAYLEREAKKSKQSSVPSSDRPEYLENRMIPLAVFY
jgi:hypothetical protein